MNLKTGRALIDLFSDIFRMSEYDNFYISAKFYTDLEAFGKIAFPTSIDMYAKNDITGDPLWTIRHFHIEIEDLDSLFNCLKDMKDNPTKYLIMYHNKIIEYELEKLQ